MKEINLLLTDIFMPRMGGKELTKRLIHIFPDIKVIYMPGYTDELIVAHGILKRGIEFLQKLFTQTSLVHKVRQVLDE